VALSFSAPSSKNAETVGIPGKYDPSSPGRYIFVPGKCPQIQTGFGFNAI
jgi:hypothetical protein